MNKETSSAQRIAEKCFEWLLAEINKMELRAQSEEESKAHVTANFARIIESELPDQKEAERLLQDAIDHESIQETYADGVDMASSAKWHQGRREILESVLAALRSQNGK